MPPSPPSDADLSADTYAISSYAALDDEVATHPMPLYPDEAEVAPPQVRREPPNPRDMSLSPVARAWRDRLPEHLRPRALCKRYPRLANRIALCWDEKPLAALLFKDLLIDGRGTRKGFPAQVHCELLALHDAAGLGLVAAPPGTWAH